MKYDTIPALFTAICDAIRSKDKTAGKIPHQDIPERITAISGGKTNFMEPDIVRLPYTFVSPDEILVEEVD